MVGNKICNLRILKAGHATARGGTEQVLGEKCPPHPWAHQVKVEFFGSRDAEAEELILRS